MSVPGDINSGMAADLKKRNRLMSWFVNRVGTLISPAGHGARLTILIYHRVLQAPDPLLKNRTRRQNI